MYSYLVLFFAIVLEVSGTMLLPISKNFTKLIPSLILIFSYGMSFYLLTLITNRLPLVIIYSSWAGLGIFSVAILSYFFYKQSLNWQVILGLFFIVIGVIIVNIFKGKV